MLSRNVHCSVVLVLLSFIALSSCVREDTIAAPDTGASVTRLTTGAETLIEDRHVVDELTNQAYGLHVASRSILYGSGGQIDSIQFTERAFPVVAAAAEQMIIAIELTNATREVVVDPNPTPPNNCPPPLDYCPEPPPEGPQSLAIVSPPTLMRVRGRVITVAANAVTAPLFVRRLWDDPCTDAKVIIAQNREQLVSRVPQANAIIGALRSLAIAGVSPGFEPVDLLAPVPELAVEWGNMMKQSVVLGAAVADYNTFCTNDRQIRTTANRNRLNSLVRRAMNGPAPVPRRVCSTEWIEISVDGGVTWRAMLAEVCETIVSAGD